MGLCIRPFGLLIAGDRECHRRNDAIKQQNDEDRIARIYAHSYGDGETAFEGVVGDAFGFLGGVVGSDPLSKLLGGLGAPQDAAGNVDATPILLVGAVAVVGVVVLMTARKK